MPFALKAFCDPVQGNGGLVFWYADIRRLIPLVSPGTNLSANGSTRQKTSGGRLAAGPNVVLYVCVWTVGVPIRQLAR